MPRFHSISFGRIPAISRLLFGFLLISNSPLRSHEGPSETLLRLNEKITQDRQNADLRFERATEYRVLGKLDEASRDLCLAVRFDPSLAVARMEWARVLLGLGKPHLALQVLTVGLDVPELAGAAHRLRRVRAEVHAAMGQWQSAVEDMTFALEASAQDPDGYLLLGRWLSRMGEHQAAADRLAEGFAATGSFVVKIQWIETLMDAGRHAQALPEIERELSASRWRASWLIRRAQARQGLGMNDEARTDLQEAFEEISQRLHPLRPDPSQVAERCLALALLGQTEKALDDYALARRLKAEPWMLERAQRILEDAPALHAP